MNIQLSRCPNCGFKNRGGVLFCEDCGQQLMGATDETIRRYDLFSSAKRCSGGLFRQTDHFNRDCLLILQIRNAPEPLNIPLAQGQVTLGRRDSKSVYQVDVDLTPFGAHQKGVSRHHAVLFRGEENVLYIVDLESANGTFVNGHPLPPQEPYPVDNGDEITLGKLRMHAYFERPAFTSTSS